MSDSDPIGDEEYLYRAVPNVKGHIEFKDNKLILGQACGSASSGDEDGLSLFRSDFVTPKKLVEKLRNKNGYYVFKVKASELRALQLDNDLKPTPELGVILGLPGHVSFPDITTKNKNRPMRSKFLDLLNDIERLVLTPEEYLNSKQLKSYEFLTKTMH